MLWWIVIGIVFWCISGFCAGRVACFHARSCYLWWPQLALGPCSVSCLWGPAHEGLMGCGMVLQWRCVECWRVYTTSLCTRRKQRWCLCSLRNRPSRSLQDMAAQAVVYRAWCTEVVGFKQWPLGKADGVGDCVGCTGALVSAMPEITTCGLNTNEAN